MAHATGGLKDTIISVEEGERATGFLFNEASAEALLRKLVQALEEYSRSEDWERLQKNGMAQDFSWMESSKKYNEEYRKLLIQHKVIPL